MSDQPKATGPAAERALLLERLLREKGLARGGTQSIPRRRVEGPCAVSFAQERVWFFEQMEPGSSVYHMPFAERLRGPLDVAALERAVNAVVVRHEALRTTFTTIGGQPMQVVGQPQPVTIPIVDLSALAEAAREAEVLRRITEAEVRPFSLAEGPLFRLILLKLAPEEHVFVLVIHHLIFDGWSFTIFCKDLALVYAAAHAGALSPLPVPPIQYADFAAWQREWLSGEVLSRQLAYWKEKLGEEEPPLELPVDLPRASVSTYGGAAHELTLPSALTAPLQRLSRDAGATLFMTLLSAFKVLLHRHTGRQKLTLGTPIANRNRSETEDVIGLFLNTLVLRSDLTGDPTFSELLAQVRATTAEAYDHQDLPFEKLVEELHPAREPNVNPLFDVLVNNYPPAHLELPGLSRLELAHPLGHSKFLFTLYVIPDGEELRLSLTYRRDLYSAEHMRHLMEQYVHLLGQIATAPGTRISRYSLVTPSARALLPDPTVVLPEPAHDPVHVTFAAQAERTPDAPAVRDGERVVTYRELAERSCGLARALVSAGVARGDVVAVSGPRSLGLVTGMMAVLGSGGVLLTIDRALPAERQKLIVREARATFVLYIGEPRPEHQWMDAIGLRRVTVALDGTLPAPAPPAALPAPGDDDAAYVFFTSGTTGVPKGVLGRHRGLAHFVDWQKREFAIGPGDRSAQLTGLSFDVLLRDVFTPLAAGATLCLPPDEPGPDTLAWLEREEITLLHTVPSLLQSWLVHVPKELTLRRLRWVFSAGEPLTDALVRRFQGTFPQAGGIANFYGPTETSLAKFAYRVPAEPPPGVQPVGWPLPETQGWVLTAKGELAGIGEPGEVAIRTPFRSAGYLHAPDATRAKFTKNPFRDDERDLVYHTGDRGRVRPDGALELSGRTDDQIKIRGIRVEPAEIQAVLGGHPDVQAAAVVVREDGGAGRKLVAYVVFRAGSATTARELRDFAEGLLPEYMVPSAFVPLAALPLTPNGKLDRRALPAPEAEPEPESAPPAVAPRTPAEEVMAAIWAEVLGLERLGVHDDFFELGGHSLLAIRLVARARETFKVELPMRSLFESPTVARLVAEVERRLFSRDGLAMPPLAKRTHVGDVPLTVSQQANWAREESQPGRLNVERTYRVKGHLDVGALERALGEIVRRHGALRTRFMKVGDEPVARVMPPGELRLPVVDLRPLPDALAAARHLAMEAWRRRYDLARDPLFRALLYRLGDEDYLFVLLMHHIVMDGASDGVFAGELEALYSAFRDGRTVSLPELAFEHADYAEWQARWLKSPGVEAQVAYWRKRLAGVPPALRLARTRPPPTVTGARFYEWRLPSRALEAVRTLGRSNRCSAFMTILSALDIVIGYRAGVTDVLLPAANSGRRAETVNLIGQFLTEVLLRTDLSGDPTFREVMVRARETVLEASAHQEVPVHRALPEGTARLIAINWQEWGHQLALDGLTLEFEALPVATRGPRFELEISVVNVEGWTFIYDVEAYDEATMAALARQLVAVLERAGAEPDVKLSELRTVLERVEAGG